MKVGEAKKLFAYKVDDDSNICIYGYKGTEKKVELPSEIGGKRVTSIGNYAFAGCENLASITIPNSVTSIGDCAFEGCANLKNIAVPDSVKNIDNWAFWNCKSLRNVSLPYSCIVGKKAIPEGTSVEFI